ncbi:restriction endonuclease subunit S [Streptomyces sp. ID05-04B]|uniref:restriction endonuclease subunit S n=1 Tax=Streptomyces sp. ID05-04B TaxID=3028661 RepID=UPI0029C3CB3B|nr:restriction endonuclease subunit S [Streptomyces sp. ID05-04B]MDX5566984.1 restriction endonuclease subunit S [Streptomyces sp. ID05-04B]
MSLNLDKSTWKRVRLGDVIRRSRTQADPANGDVDRYVGGGHIDTDSLTIERFGDVNDGQMGSTFTYLFQPGQILFVSARPYLRKSGVVNFSGVVADKTYVLDAVPENGLLQEFLPFVLASDHFIAYATTVATGSMNPRLLWGQLQRYEFDLPPLDEQKRLANILWALERHGQAVVDERVRSLRLYEATRIALLAIGPDGDWRSVEWDAEQVNRWTDKVPDGWSRETIASVGRVRSGATPNRTEQARYFDGGTIPWVKTLDLNEGVLRATDECITSVAVAETSVKVLLAGTVLVAMYGGFGQIGRTARLGVDAATNQAVSAVVDLRSDVSPEFLHEVLKAGRPKWRRVAASSRKDPNITKRDVEGFDFPLPPPELQSRILSILATLQSGTDALDAEASGIRELRSSLLAEVFGGAK